jgi:DNA-binding IclR family transcriptional regulator
MSSAERTPRRLGDERPEKRVSVVSRAAAVLECFTSDLRSASLAELSACLALPKPTVFRIATVLKRMELLEQNPITGAYTVGFAGLRYADALLGSIRIRPWARPVMEELRDTLNETIVLSIREGDLRYNVDSVESTHAIGQTQKIGAPIPLYAGAASRVMMAAMPEADFDSYLARIAPIAYSDTTITNFDELRAATESARRDGFVVTSGEYTVGSHAVACLIEAPRDFEVAALHVSIPRARRTKTLERRAVQALQAGVRKISKSLSASA